MPVKLRYRNFADRLDIDAVEEAMGFDVVSSTANEDTGYCFDLYDLHSNGDTTGKLSINRDKKVYNCWVCGGGSLLSLVMDLKHLDVEDATVWLYQFVDGEETQEAATNRLKNMLHHEPEVKTTLPYFNEHVLDRFEDKYHPWFRKRGITQDVQQTYKLRFNPTAMKRPPKNKPDEDPYIGPAIILPHFWKGRLVGWQHRWLKDDRPKWCAKYTNTGDFPKNETLFNYDRAKTSRYMMPIVLESVPSALFLESCGYPAIATFGSEVTEDQMKLLRTFQSGLILAFDNDKAGIKGRNALTRYLQRYIPIWHMPLVGDKDQNGDLGDLAPRHDLVDEYVSRAYEPLTKTLERMRNE